MFQIDSQINVTLNQQELTLISLALSSLPKDFKEVRKLIMDLVVRNHEMMNEDIDIHSENFGDFIDSITHLIMGQKPLLEHKLSMSVMEAEHQDLAKDLEKALEDLLPAEVSAKAVKIPGDENTHAVINKIMEDLGVNVGVLQEDNGDDYEEIGGEHENS